MDLHTVVALILSGAIGISLGLLGGGGSILAVPVLVYVAGNSAAGFVGHLKVNCSCLRLSLSRSPPWQAHSSVNISRAEFRLRVCAECLPGGLYTAKADETSVDDAIKRRSTCGGPSICRR